MIKLLLLLFSTALFSFNLENYSTDEQSYIKNFVDQNKFNFSILDYSDAKAKYDAIIQDPENRISDQFSPSKFFSPFVQFWFNIYTTFDSYHVVIHDKENLGFVYDTLQFHSLKNSSMPQFVRSGIISNLVNNYISKLKIKLNYIAIHGSRHADKSLIKKLKSFGIKIPRRSKARKKMFKNLSKNLRSQTGQRDFVKAGLVRLQPYYPTLSYYADLFNLPKEVIAISLLESSFNIKARSKADALGAWQFMPRVAKQFMTVNKSIDDRYDPIISSISAFFLLKSHFRMLEDWGATIVSYNSGVKHLLRDIRAKKKKNYKFSLDDFVKYYKHPHMGFAAKNFYAEFIALAHSFAYKEKLFKDLNDFESPKVEHYLYLSKCSFRPSLLKSIHPNLKYSKKIYRRGTLISSNKPMNRKLFQKVSPKLINTRYPKNFRKRTKLQRCSIK